MRRARSTRASRMRSTGTIDPSMKRVTRYPSGSTNATTSGPTPTAAAASEASCSTRAVDPEERSVAAGDAQDDTTRRRASTLKLWFVMPPPSTATRASSPGQMRATIASTSMVPIFARSRPREVPSLPCPFLYRFWHENRHHGIDGPDRLCTLIGPDHCAGTIVVRLVRRAPTRSDEVQWDIEAGRSTRSARGRRRHRSPRGREHRAALERRRQAARARARASTARG